MDEASVRTELLLEAREKRDHLVLDPLLDGEDPRDVHARRLADARHRVGGDAAAAGVGLAHGELHSEPRRVFGLLAPEAAHLRAGVTLDHALTLEQNTPQWKCEPEDVAGLGPRRPRRAKHENRASRRTSRGWGPAVRGQRNTRIVRAGGRRGAGVPPSEASETRESCEPEDVAGLGPRRPRPAKHENRASRRTSRGWGPAVRGQRNTRIVRAGGRRGAGAPPSEASETRESCEPEDVARRGVWGAMSGRRSQTRSSLRLDRDASRGDWGAMSRPPNIHDAVRAGGCGDRGVRAWSGRGGPPRRGRWQAAAPLRGR